ncbi:uncharacterized protein TOL2_C15850 [Desulfobacula toluolica Tol2]|uniref:Uncharacterized protein n=1 Tax=Desulfobacula toluolica (strain DSM 7467 / Tol2) TaxID=651182 RepID=K0NIU8_DESTT|nr:uncharacterized protein TOL2_C15850 [Desulfobacula toluolica Tol2]
MHQVSKFLIYRSYIFHGTVIVKLIKNGCTVLVYTVSEDIQENIKAQALIEFVKNWYCLPIMWTSPY